MRCWKSVLILNNWRARRVLKSLFTQGCLSFFFNFIFFIQLIKLKWRLRPSKRSHESSACVQPANVAVPMKPMPRLQKPVGDITEGLHLDVLTITLAFKTSTGVCNVLRNHFLLANVTPNAVTTDKTNKESRLWGCCSHASTYIILIFLIFGGVSFKMARPWFPLSVTNLRFNYIRLCVLQPLWADSVLRISLPSLNISEVCINYQSTRRLFNLTEYQMW